MTGQRFISFAKYKVLQWLWHNVEDMDGISYNDIFVVWYSKTLQNRKVLLGTCFTNHYFECTFNGDKGEMYVDVYDKVQNECFKVTQLNNAETSNGNKEEMDVYKKVQNVCVKVGKKKFSIRDLISKLTKGGKNGK
jgi:hypothetical protein